VPVFYVVAPQVWAWRQGRVTVIRDLVQKLFCLFPFEKDWFQRRNVDALYIGHPLASMVRIQTSREEFFASHGLPEGAGILVLLPGSRAGEARRHMPVLLDAVALLRKRFPLSVLLAIPKGFRTSQAFVDFREPIQALSIKVVENETWDCLGHADLALAASGTVTIEAAVLGTPMVTFYKVNPLSWWAGRHLVKVPFLSMVNLVAQHQIVPELIQHDMTAERIAQEAEQLLADHEKADRMRTNLAWVRAALTVEGDPLKRAADVIAQSCDIHQTSAVAQMDVVRETIG
jgi:lipid-A-disaccharide synthase